MSTLPQTKLKVGVTLHIRNGTQSLWENGIFQNCLFLVMLLERAPHVGEVYLVHGGDGKLEHREQLLSGLPFQFLSMDEAHSVLDVTIEMSAQLDAAWVASFRDKGGKIIAAHVGNDYAIDVERMIFDKPHGHLMNGAAYHAVWTLPEYLRTCVPYYAAATRVATTTMPHLWSPVVLERAIANLPSDKPYGYQVGAKAWRVAIFEPNLSVVKTSFIPLLGCEVAHRQNPHALDKVYAFNTAHLQQHSVMQGFCDALNIHRHGLVEYHNRAATFEVMAHYANAVVSHQWENAQNYLYYELLWGGYPLIHNSPFVEQANCGYYYPDFDCEQAGAAILNALATHDENLADYQRNARTYLHSVDPYNPENIAIYDRAIVGLFD